MGGRAWKAALAGAMVGMVVLAACAPPTPTPAPTPTATSVVEEMGLYEYLDAVEPYASIVAVVRAYDLSVVEADLILFKLERMRPPHDLAASHENLITAYRYIRDGQQILAQQPIRELRAEGEFQVDWGIRYIFIFQEEIATYMESRLPEEGAGEE
ncbi:MAG: hypothetical protein H5T59_00025 [Anaerolineae bacterium]|nr:hypothetical protein [Anaerolineae bacterium]